MTTVFTPELLAGFVSNAQFSDLIHEINKNTTERRAMVQCALKHAAYHAQVHRNSDPAIRLFAVVGRETNRQGMATWLADNAPIGFKDNVPFFHEKKWKENASVTGAEVEAMLKAAPNWWAKKSSTSEIADTMDILELVRAIIKKADANAKKETGKKEVKHGDLLTKLAAMANDTQYAN